MILNATQQQLWAAVYAAEYARLAALAAAGEKPEHGKSWMYGCALAGNHCAEAACSRADAAVRYLNERSTPG